MRKPKDMANSVLLELSEVELAVVLEAFTSSYGPKGIRWRFEFEGPMLDIRLWLPADVTLAMVKSYLYLGSTDN